jgi:hypothetical protein
VVEKGRWRNRLRRHERHAEAALLVRKLGAFIVGGIVGIAKRGVVWCWNVGFGRFVVLRTDGTFAFKGESTSIPMT